MADYVILGLRVGALVVIGFIVYFILKHGLRILFHRNYLPAQLYQVAAGIFRWLIALLVVLMGLHQFGVSVATFWHALWAVIALIGVAFVAVWSILSNIFSAVLLIIFSPFRLGDEIEIIEPTGVAPGVRGKVIGLNILFTTLEQTSAEDGTHYLVEVPNNTFFQKTIRRKHGTETRSLEEGMKRIG